MLKLKILLISMLIPGEFAVFIGPLQLECYRIVLIFFFFDVLLNGFFNKPNLKLRHADYLYLCATVWPTISISVNEGVTQAIETGGALFLEMFVPYFLARMYLVNIAALQSFVRTMIFFIGVLMVVGIVEAFTGRYYVHEIASSITGNSIKTDGTQRLGLYRAQVSFIHPIMYGIFCSSIVGVVLAEKKILTVIKRFSVTLFATIVSGSSAAILSILIQCCMSAWSILSRGVKLKWIPVFVAFVLAFILLELVTSGGALNTLYNKLLIIPQTGYARHLQWSNGLGAVNLHLDTMLFGIGRGVDFVPLVADRWIGSLLNVTVDSYWLYQIMFFGWPMAVLLGMFVIISMRSCIKLSQRFVGQERKYLIGWFVSVFSMTFISVTVHLIHQMLCLYVIFLAVGFMRIEEKPE